MISSNQQIFSDKIYKEISETTIAIENYLSSENYSELSSIIDNLTDEELIDILQTIRFDMLKELVKVIDNRLTSNMLTALDEGRTELIYETIGTSQFSRLMNGLDDHNFYDFIHHHKNLEDYDNYLSLYKNLNEDKKLILKDFFKYPEYSAARLMQRNFIALPDNLSIEQIKKKLSILSKLSQDIDCILLVDDDNKVTGTISFGTILTKPDDVLVSNIMKKHFIVVNTNTNQKKVARLFHRYTLSFVLVAGINNNILGVITLHDITDAIEIQADEDLFHLQYISSPEAAESKNILKSVGARIPWLFVNVVLSMLVSGFVSLFTDVIEKHIALAVFIPIIASISSISGAQTIATTIHNLAKQDVDRSNMFRIFTHEILTSIFVATCMALLSCIVVYWRFGPHMALIYFIAMLFAFIIASLSGIFIPVITNYIKLDPAIISPILVTTISDFCSYLLALMLAIWLLG